MLTCHFRLFRRSTYAAVFSPATTHPQRRPRQCPIRSRQFLPLTVWALPNVAGGPVAQFPALLPVWCAVPVQPLERRFAAPIPRSTADVPDAAPALLGARSCPHLFSLSALRFDTPRLQVGFLARP